MSIGAYPLGWIQSNADGFGDPENILVAALASFAGSLYAGTYNSSTGAQLWRQDGRGHWEPVITDGFGDADANAGINHLLEFQGRLYASTWRWRAASRGAQVWRSEDGTHWTPVVSESFGDPTNGEIFRFTVFNDVLYASTTSYTITHGAELWRSPSGDPGSWEQVVANGFGDPENLALVGATVFNSHLYVGTWNGTTGGQVWHTGDGNSWAPVSSFGFGDSKNFVVSSLAGFGDHLYATTGHWAEPRNFDSFDGIEIWRCQRCAGSDWEQMVPHTFWPAQTGEQSALLALEGHLYLAVGNKASGMQVWQSGDGVTWEPIAREGFGDRHNIGPRWSNSVTIFNRSLYVGTDNQVSGGEVWQYLPNALYLPLIQR